jgi:hypothetical protein
LDHVIAGVQWCSITGIPADQLSATLRGDRGRDVAGAPGEVRGPQDVPRLLAAIEAVLAGHNSDGMPSPF